jgi:hypothetical protein
MFLCDVWFQVAVVSVGFLQPAKCVGGVFAKAQEITAKFIPKKDARLTAKTVGKFQRERPVAGADDIFTKLLLVRRKNTDAAPTS